MFDVNGIMSGVSLLLQWQILLVIVLGLLYGIITGAIPGFSTALSISVMLPVTYTMSPLVAIVFLTAVYAGGNFGSSISAILLNIPGSPQAIVTTLDGYPMTKQGKGNEALGVAVAASSIGNMIGSFFLILVMPFIVVLALKFGPPELFMVAVLGLTVIASLHRSFLRSVIAGLFGVLIGTIGMTPTGAVRGTYGFYELMDGIPIIPALIGLVGFSELIYMIQKDYVTKNNISVKSGSWNSLIKGFKDGVKYRLSLFRSSTIGVIIGALPGAGATIASVVSYNEGKRFSKKPEEFGKGSRDGIVCSESANNASEGGALATMLSLGIPGGTATAVLIGALMIQGLVPGPMLFVQNEALVYGIMLSQFITSALMLIVGLVVCYYAARVINIPTKILIPIIAVFSIFGTYAINKSMFDVKLMLVFGVLGVILRKYDYPIISVILGIILGPLLDNELLRIYQRFGDDFSIFLSRPISLVLVIIFFISLIPPIVKVYKKRKAT
ncbi:tripartite tricarboxylate transporter permease [Alkalihalobacterium alkalinitrilicum]|uniref:tripartite tricarboxylate transporter permease n=1 Tax=Alkalihalobacterium alkalinitrilicum TaxID=427920 RepID=UPI000994B87A|nr:tripartite tricarboxylate transporter permease [Alkalihalobacterium alkalinitrilicum]